MKTLIFFLFTICMITESNAQNSSVDPHKELLNLLTSKHDYERNLAVRNNKDLPSFKTKYNQSYTKIKGNKAKIILYIDKALKENASSLSKEFIFYQFPNPLSSNVDPNNRLSLLSYFKLVKYSLENSKTVLPALSEVPPKKLL